jgi:hypothetical protein
MIDGLVYPFASHGPYYQAFQITTPFDFSYGDSHYILVGTNRPSLQDRNNSRLVPSSLVYDDNCTAFDRNEDLFALIIS